MIDHPTTAATSTVPTTNAVPTGMNGRRPAHRLGRNATIAAVVAVAVGFSGCSAIVEKATERVVEEGVERAVEADTGEDVDIDFDADGSFSIETDDGSFSFDEEGSCALETDDGDFAGRADGDGYVIEGEDGIVVDAGFDDDGSFTLDTDDGSLVSGTGDDAWELWPSDIDRPAYADDAVVTGTRTDDELWVLASGSVDEGDAVRAIDDFVDGLDGFTAADHADVLGELATVVENGTYSVSVFAEQDIETTGTTLTVTVVRI